MLFCREQGEGPFLLASGHCNGSIRLWNSKSTQLLTTLLSHRMRITDLVFSPRAGPNGNPVLISISTDKTIKIWDGEYHGYNMCSSIQTSIVAYCCDIHISGQFFAICGDTNVVYTYNLSDDDGSNGRVTQRRKLHGHGSIVVKCKYTKNGAFLLTASRDTKVNVWNSYDGTLALSICHVYPPPNLFYNYQIIDLACNSMFTAVATINTEGRLCLWDPNDSSGVIEVDDYHNKKYTVIHCPKAEAYLNDQSVVCTFSNQGNHLLIGEMNGSVSVLNLCQPVSSLSLLCRHSIRTLMLSDSMLNQDIEALGLPAQLQRYLKYDTHLNWS